MLTAFVDLDGVADSVAALRRAFPDSVAVLHAFAAKANPLVPLLAELRGLGMGCEVASAGELAQALAAGFTPDQIVFDSPAKTPFTRFAITSADHVTGSKLDLYAFDTDGNHLGDWADPDSDEHGDLPPGDYDVYVLQYELPAGTTGQQYTLWSWKVGQGTPAVTPTITPAEQNVSVGDRPEVTVSRPDNIRGKGYVGAVEYGDCSTALGHTVLTLTP